MPKVTCTSQSPETTRALGKSWAEELRAGMVIGLKGDLGAGKTELVKGIAAGLRITARIHSPTFNLINIYPGPKYPLYHLDLYRLNSPEEIIGAGLEEYLVAPNGVTVVEWIERWLPSNAAGPIRLVEFEIINPDQRRITYEDFGA